MKKFIFSLVMMLTMFIGVANAQSNYASSSHFTDNWSVSLSGGVVTPFNHFFADGSTTPIVVVGVDKYVTPWLGFGIEGRTSIGTGDNFNIHTAFDMVNVSVNGEFNLVNMFAFDGTRRMFEPVVYMGLGWGHVNCSDYNNVGFLNHTTATRNYLTYRAGVEFNFNLGKEHAWAIVVNPSVVWGNICNGRLDKRCGNFELTAGVVYHFKTSNGTHSYTKARLYDAAEVAALNARIAELEARKPVVVNRVVNQTIVAPVTPESTYAVSFTQNSAELSDEAKAALDNIPTDVTVNIAGSTSPEGTSRRNTVLAVERANAVAEYLRSRGVTVNEVRGGDAGRVAVITIQK